MGSRGSGSTWSITKRYGPALGSLLVDAKIPTKSGGAAMAVAAVAGQLMEMLPWMVDLREGQA